MVPRGKPPAAGRFFLYRQSAVGGVCAISTFIYLTLPPPQPLLLFNKIANSKHAGAKRFHLVLSSFPRSLMHKLTCREEKNAFSKRAPCCKEHIHLPKQTPPRCTCFCERRSWVYQLTLPNCQDLIVGSLHSYGVCLLNFSNWDSL